MPRKIMSPCKGRKTRKCKVARKSCKMTNGVQRKSHCRKTRNNVTRNKK